MEFKADSKFAMVCLRLGGFGVRPRCADMRALEGGGGSGARPGVAEGSIAREGEGALGAHLELPHTVLGNIVGLRGSVVRFRFQYHLESDMSAEEGFAVEGCRADGAAEFFVFFCIEEGGKEFVVGREAAISREDVAG